MKVDKKRKPKKTIWHKLLIVLFWLLLWQIVAWSIGNVILLEGPIGVVKRLLEDLQTLEYYRTVGTSVFRIMCGLLCGVFFAVILGVLAWKQKSVEEMFQPLIQFLKAAPITCFVVLLLIWAGAKNLAFYIALLVAFPPVYFNFLEGLKQLDRRQLEVAKVYHMPWKNRLRYIYLPGVKPYFLSALTLAVGMAFKAGVAAEIIGTPDYSMGERIYMSKIYLDTAGVLSWMLTVIVVAYLCEKIIVGLANAYFNKRPAIYGKPTIADSKRMVKTENIKLKDCTVSYETEVILKDFSVELAQGKIYAITGKSGIGKTTLLNVLLGLKKAEDGEISGNSSIQAGVFQENRLFEEYTATENVFATGHCLMEKEDVEAALGDLLQGENISKPVKEYSGGMKRRVEIARAMLSDSPIIVMDEPFTGLDDITKEKAICFIEKYRKSRTILFTTHCPLDIKKVKAEELKL